ncbi:MAG: HAMP domain-containing sensor histidine kinase [Nocardioidaceae bacterium]
MTRRLLPTSLTGRLVAIVVTLVALAAVLVAGATTVAMRSYFNDRLDSDVAGSLDRAVRDYVTGVPTGAVPNAPDDHVDGDGDHVGDDEPRIGRARGQGVGTLTAAFGGAGSGPSGRGNVLTKAGTFRSLSASSLNVLAGVPVDGRTHAVSLPEVGDYRVQAMSVGSGSVVAGLSTRDIDATIGRLLTWTMVVALGAIAVSGLTGRWLVRRQLRPLRDVAATAHEVSTLPLSTGEIGTTVRVPDRLTDERTEVGSVGSALNTMIAHVERALDERHRSELQVRQFVADASHELRTPLSTIHGYAELSRRTRPADPAQLELAMGKVEAEATRMSSLVEDLLLLARLDAGRPLARDEVDVTRLVLETVGDARVVGPGHRWVMELPEEPLVVTGDEQRLHQVVTNLLNNARRHTPPGTQVTARVAEDDRHVVVVVEDDGPGMPPELVATAFERFSRGDSSRTRESGGAGLGLSLVQAITTAHAGTVAVTSRPGRTRFEVRLPRHESLTAGPRRVPADAS